MRDFRIRPDKFTIDQDVTTPIYSEVSRIVTEMVEKEDDFIISKFQEYADRVILIEETHVPKQLIKRALQCFKEEHQEEFEHLMKIANER